MKGVVSLRLVHLLKINLADNTPLSVQMVCLYSCGGIARNMLEEGVTLKNW